MWSGWRTPEQIRPALERAFASGIPALVNVVVDSEVRVVTQPFSAYQKGAVWREAELQGLGLLQRDSRYEGPDILPALRTS